MSATIVLLAWWGTTMSMASSSEPRPPPGAVRARSSPHHLGQVGFDERFHLRPIDGDVVVELGVGPDDRVHLADRAAGIDLHDLDVGRRTRRGGPNYERGCPVAEDHP